jgi:DNA-binding NarL/FixJ family response regulator
MTPPACQPILATKQPLLIARVRELLRGAGIPSDPQVIHPEELERVLTATRSCIAILDGESVPDNERLLQLRRASPHSFLVVWTNSPTARQLQSAVECGLHGLLSSRLPPQEASIALRRICRGERLFRFDSEPTPLDLPKPRRLSGRERQILFLLVEGATNGNIAIALDTTESTIKVCLSRMFRKTGARNRGELAALGRTMILTADPLQPSLPAGTPFDAQWMLHGVGSQTGKI